MTAQVMSIDSATGDLLLLWQKTESVGTIAEAALIQGYLPPNLRRDIADFFKVFRRDLAAARKSFPKTP
jgi:hypothetical protein